jgi:putative CRISPR-associated protein (TIGR02619 family)
MPISVISTVGRSIITNMGKDFQGYAAEFERQPNLDLNAIATNIKDFQGEDLYRLALDNLNSKKSNAVWLRATSAEINSLMHLLDGNPPDNNDVLHFIATETPDGVLAARILADFTMDYFGRDTEIHIIEGLQVKDGTRFRRIGLRSLIKHVYANLRNAPAESNFRRIINPTGGFKGVVPYLTIIGMLEKNVEISYIYEQSPELITLAGLPISFDYNQLRDALPLMEQSKTKDMLSEKDFIAELGIGPKEVSYHPAWAFFDVEEIDGENYYALNGLGAIALGHLQIEERIPVYLSRQANETLGHTAPGSDELRNYHKILNGIHDPQLRSNNMHTVPNKANALVYKLGRQSERAFYVDNGDHVLVLELARHINATDYNIYPELLKNYGKFEKWEQA